MQVAIWVARCECGRRNGSLLPLVLKSLRSVLRFLQQCGLCLHLQDRAERAARYANTKLEEKASSPAQQGAQAELKKRTASPSTRWNDYVSNCANCVDAKKDDWKNTLSIVNMVQYMYIFKVM